jgi:hypothetical protein
MGSAGRCGVNKTGRAHLTHRVLCLLGIQFLDRDVHQDLTMLCESKVVKVKLKQGCYKEEQLGSAEAEENRSRRTSNQHAVRGCDNVQLLACKANEVFRDSIGLPIQQERSTVPSL